VRTAELTRRLADLRPFPSPDPTREQVATPPEAAALLLERAAGAGDVQGLAVGDLGCGTGILGIGAALLGAARVVGIDSDPAAIEVARENARTSGVEVELEVGPVEALAGSVDTVVMNPPFGAQRRHADRPFWETALRCAGRAVYAFALADSRTFIARSVVERGAAIRSTEPVPWRFPATFPHHRKARTELAVDLWVLGTAPDPP
jgi:putative methylase